jgi:[ribosomal protein S18]-alanine N-acetyltransferase
MVRPQVAVLQEGNFPQTTCSFSDWEFVCGKSNSELGLCNGGFAATMAGVQFTIRDFQPDDFETLWRIDQTCFPPGISYSRAELKFYMRRRTAFTLVAEMSEEKDQEKARKNVNLGTDQAAKKTIAAGIIGFLVAEAAEKKRGHIITIDVMSTVRRFRVGSQLLQAAETRLLSMKCTSVELETAVDNAAALPFYKRHGYSVVGTHPRYYSNGVDALVLEKVFPTSPTA